MEKTFDFDHFESRLPWGQVKWEPAELEKTFGTQDVLPAWIADMDLKTLPEVQEAIIEAARTACMDIPKSLMRLLRPICAGSNGEMAGMRRRTGSVLPPVS